MTDIMVIERKKLFHRKIIDGFLPANVFDFESVILSDYTWMNKKQAETNYNYKQPVGYSIIYNPSLKKVFVYQRSKKDQDYDEKRLQGKWSCGVGGHIEKIDTANGNPIHESSLREIQEEIHVKGKKEMKILGYINDDSNDVGKVHFGILYLVLVNDPQIEPLDPEISQGNFISIGDFEEKCNSPDLSVENWSKIALEPLKKF